MTNPSIKYNKIQWNTICYPWNHGPNSFKLVWRCHRLLSRFLFKSHLPRQSRRSLMIRVIIKWSRGLCTDLLAFTLQLIFTRKTSSMRPSDEGAVRPVIVSNDLEMRSMGIYCTSGREKDRTTFPIPSPGILSYKPWGRSDIGSYRRKRRRFILLITFPLKRSLLACSHLMIVNLFLWFYEWIHIYWNSLNDSAYKCVIYTKV